MTVTDIAIKMFGFFVLAAPTPDPVTSRLSTSASSSLPKCEHNNITELCQTAGTSGVI